MKRNAMRKNLRQSIIKSLGRYIAISAIIALGAGLFLGLQMSKADMVTTGQKFVDEQNMFDFRMISNYGWTEEYVEKFSTLEGVQDAEGLFYIDLIAKTELEEEAVYRFYSIPQRVNLLALRGGRMPQRADECLADGFYYDDSALGQTVTVSVLNKEDSLDTMKEKTFTIVGYVSSPLYMDMNRGTTSIGSGTLQNYFYIPESAFDVEHYNEINLTLEEDYPIYSQEYTEALDMALDALEDDAEELAQQRYQDVRTEVEEEYNEGYQEYLDGLQEYEDGKAEAEQELSDAESELLDAQKKIDDGYADLMQAESDIKLGYAKLEEAKGELYVNRNLLLEKLETIQTHISQAKDGIAQIEDATGMSGSQLEQTLSTAQEGIVALSQGIAAMEQQLAAAQQTLAALQADPTADPMSLAMAQGTVDAIAQQLSAARASLPEAQANLNMLLGAYESYTQASSALAQLNGGKAQLDAALQQIDAMLLSLEREEEALSDAQAKLLVSWVEWGEGRDELAEGWIEYEDAKREAEEELAEAEAELKDAEEELRDAREEIDSMDESELIILNRESNVGYNNLDSSSDIVAGVSRVFPVFFLLIAALVCITTMTRMIDEERTQIGTLKALGYTNQEIIHKYLVYSGSGAMIGCTLGISLGCTIFPQIIWEAYKIMLHIQPDVVLTVNWPLAIAVVVVYLAVMLLVTWYCCYKTLQEEPAELIRPKAPDAGKKILLERLPAWQKLGFLNKVAIRNIFRYRQRLAMMLIGIGGCTALLIAGFGLRDSVVNVVDYQFQDVTQYDLSVYFREELSQEEREEFQEVIHDGTLAHMFYHQSSVELEYNSRIKEIYMISGEEDLETFLDLHTGDTKLGLPGSNEIVLSVGVAEILGIRTGDRVTVRSADLEEMELTVSGIYDNYVYNYCIVASQTIESQWGEEPELQMAFISVMPEQDVHTLSAAVTELDTVLNVSVSEDLADMVRSMMQALDLVVMVAVVSAALLAVIVLYNLTNININERIREIATIKVLGFNAAETASYVFKENMVLTVAGSAVGLLMGRLLLEFIMSQVKIDFVWFKAMLTPKSCILAIVITLLSAIVVEFIFYFKLDKINMAEALKSVE